MPVQTFTEDEVRRYHRHIDHGQGRSRSASGKLLNARVLLLGAGGLGSPAALYLAAAGVGTLGIVDFDAVDLSNLQRQILHRTDTVGKLKVDSAGADASPSINPGRQRRQASGRPALGQHLRHHQGLRHHRRRNR